MSLTWGEIIEAASEYDPHTSKEINYHIGLKRGRREGKDMFSPTIKTLQTKNAELEAQLSEAKKYSDGLCLVIDEFQIKSLKLEAQLSALREPNDAMLDAVFGKCCCAPNYGDDVNGPHCYRCEIDAEGSWQDMLTASTEDETNGGN